MKKVILILSVFLLFLTNCEKTGNCTDETSYIKYDELLNVFEGDTIPLPYEKILIADEILYDTEIKQDTIFEQDTVIVADTIFKNKTFAFSVISDTSLYNYILSPDNEIINGNETAGEDFNLIKIYLNDVIINKDSLLNYAVIDVYKGVFFSDCSSW